MEIVYSDEFLWQNAELHPESAERVLAIKHVLDEKLKPKYIAPV